MMPTNRKRKPRSRSNPPIDEWKIEYLKTRIMPDVDEEKALDAWQFRNDRDAQREVWNAERVNILSSWIRLHPGTRPHSWWLFDAPIHRGKGRHKKFELRGVRRRTGGIGSDASEHLAYKPEFVFGVPVKWIEADDIAVFDLKVEAYDHKNPPKYESQAKYLKKHDLLTKSEQKKLKPFNFRTETVEKAFKDVYFC